jgi:hypothetical protein
MTSDSIIFEPVNDLMGMKHALYREELGQRKVLVSPAMHSLLQTDRSAVLSSLKVMKGDREIWVMDLGGDLS